MSYFEKVSCINCGKIINVKFNDNGGFIKVIGGWVVVHQKFKEGKNALKNYDDTIVTIGEICNECHDKVYRDNIIKG